MVGHMKRRRVDYVLDYGRWLVVPWRSEGGAFVKIDLSRVGFLFVVFLSVLLAHGRIADRWRFDALQRPVLEVIDQLVRLHFGHVRFVVEGRIATAVLLLVVD